MSHSSVFHIINTDGLFHQAQVHTSIEGSFQAFKVLMGFLYFNRLIIKDKNDFQLIREICEMTERYSVEGLLNEISAELKNRITFESLNQILILLLNIEFKDLMEKVFEFIQLNVEEIIKSDVQEVTNKTQSELVLTRNIFNVMQRYNISNGIRERIAVLLVNWITFDNLVIINKIAVDFNIEDLIMNCKDFLNKNMSQLNSKEVNDLIEINKIMDNKLLTKHLIERNQMNE